MNFSNITIAPQAIPWLVWCLLAPVLAARITTMPNDTQRTDRRPVVVLAKFFVVGVVAALPSMIGRHAATFGEVLLLALPSVGGAAAAYGLAQVMPNGVPRSVRAALAVFVALVGTVATWFALFLEPSRL